MKMQSAKTARMKVKVMDLLNDTPEGMCLKQLLDCLDGREAPTTYQLSQLLRYMTIEGDIETSDDGRRLRYTITMKEEKE